MNRAKGTAHAISRLLLGKQRVRFLRWKKMRKELSILKKADVVFVSYAKSGRTWTRVMISRLFQLKYQLPENLLIEADNFNKINANIPVFLFTHGTYIANRYPLAEGPSPYSSKKVLFLCRHPADIAVSSYFHHKNRVNPRLKDVKEIDYSIEGSDVFDYVKNGPVGLRPIIRYMNDWTLALRKCPHHLMIRYEDLRADAAGELERIADFIGAKFSPEQYQDAVDFASFSRLKEKERENFFSNDRLKPRDVNNPDSFKVRRGKVGGYRDYLTPEQVTWVNEVIQSELSPVFGYGAASSGATKALPVL